ncbi:hypothetical protein ANO14919_056920 [Xylariales sp. No.14919]|nr:hypothetical protein ANO14919_056920 [Xylariales sp. No.14919]
MSPIFAAGSGAANLFLRPHRAKSRTLPMQSREDETLVERRTMNFLTTDVVDLWIQSAQISLGDACTTEEAGLDSSRMVSAVSATLASSKGRANPDKAIRLSLASQCVPNPRAWS